jgi:hypothetical protein
MERTMSVMELEDDPDKVYLVGIDLTDADKEQGDEVIEEINEVIGSTLTEADVIPVPMPVSGMQVAQLDEDEVQDLIDYHDIKEEVNDG